MNNLVQNKDFLIGSKEAIQTLEQKESANILVISDSHGSKEMLQKILQEQGYATDILFFCGDGVADLIAILNESCVNKEVNAYLPPVISVVQGNCDTSEYNLCSQDNAIKVPLFQVVNVCGSKIFCTHGHHFSLYGGVNSLSNMAKNMNASIALFGHTHIASVQNDLETDILKSTNSESKTLFLNPGSCARPRAGQAPCFATIKIYSNTDDLKYSFYRITETKSLSFEL